MQLVRDCDKEIGSGSHIGSQWLPVSIKRDWRREILRLGTTEKYPFSVLTVVGIKRVRENMWASINVQNYWVSV